jgi:ribosomal protein S18 acetylase RimI-like enzyme
MELQIRTARREDEDDLVALELAVWSPETTPAPRVTEPMPFFDGPRTPDRTFVATSGDRIVGHVLVGAGHPMPSHGHVAFLRGLSVDPAEQGRGIAKRLVAHALGELGRRGAVKVRSRVLSTNPASLAVHRACGFVEEGRLVGEFRIEPIGAVDDVLLAYWFDEPAQPRR